MAKNTERVVKFKKEGGKYTKESIAAAKDYWRGIAKEGEWDSLDELIYNYVLPMAAGRQHALDRWARANGKATSARKRKAKSAAKPKARGARKAKAKPTADANHTSAAASPAE